MPEISVELLEEALSLQQLVWTPSGRWGLLVTQGFRAVESEYVSWHFVRSLTGTTCDGCGRGRGAVCGNGELTSKQEQIILVDESTGSWDKTTTVGGSFECY